MSSYKTGDTVKVSSSFGELRGILMPNEYTDTLVLKLGSGYNIGIDKKHVLDISLVKAYEQKKQINSLPPSIISVTAVSKSIVIHLFSPRLPMRLSTFRKR